MTHKEIVIKLIDGSAETIKTKNVLRYDLEFSPQVARFDFNNGDFLEFTRQNILWIEFRKEES